MYTLLLVLLIIDALVLGAAILLRLQIYRRIVACITHREQMEFAVTLVIDYFPISAIGRAVRLNS